MSQFCQSYHIGRRESKHTKQFNSLQIEREQVKSFIKQQQQNHKELSDIIQDDINHQTNKIRDRIAQRRNSLQIDQEAKQIQKIVAYFNQRIKNIRDQVQSEDQVQLIQRLESEKLSKILEIQSKN